MERINSLVNQFNSENEGYTMRLSPEVRDEEHYVMAYVTEPVCGLTHRCYFANVDEFAEWVNGVVLD